MAEPRKLLSKNFREDEWGLAEEPRVAARKWELTAATSRARKITSKSMAEIMSMRPAQENNSSAQNFARRTAGASGA